MPGASVVYTVGAADGSVANGLEQAIDAALADATYSVQLGTAVATDDSVRIVRSDGAPAFAGDVKQIRYLNQDGLSAGDVLLIAGKGHEDYQVIGTTKIHFSDREIIEEFIRG